MVSKIPESDLNFLQLDTCLGTTWFSRPLHALWWPPSQCFLQFSKLRKRATGSFAQKKFLEDILILKFVIHVDTIKVVLWSKNHFGSFFLPILKAYSLNILGTGKILSFAFNPKAVYFECKFWIWRSAITHVQNWPIGHQRVGSRENDVIYSIA